MKTRPATYQVYYIQCHRGCGVIFDSGQAFLVEPVLDLIKVKNRRTQYPRQPT